MRVPWLADVLRSANLQVVEEPGWHGRGRDLQGVNVIVGHHTACGPGGDCPSTRILIRGRLGGPKPLPGPLCQLQLCRSGVFHTIADGKANHAGPGYWPGARSNSDTLGIEAENMGNGVDRWPAVQMDAYARGVAAILQHLNLPADRFCCHYEWAVPKGRKVDARGPWEGGGDWWSGQTTIGTRNASTFRARVRALLEEDDVTVDEACAKILARLDELFGIDGAGNARDIRKKIDAIYIDTHAEDHRDHLAGRVAAIDETINPPLGLDPAPAPREM